MIQRSCAYYAGDVVPTAPTTAGRAIVSLRPRDPIGVVIDATDDDDDERVVVTGVIGVTGVVTVVDAGEDDGEDDEDDEADDGVAGDGDAGRGVEREVDGDGDNIGKTGADDCDLINDNGSPWINAHAAHTRTGFLYFNNGNG
jgi:hypothetical protein